MLQGCPYNFYGTVWYKEVNLSSKHDLNINKKCYVKSCKTHETQKQKKRKERFICSLVFLIETLLPVYQLII